MHNDASPNTLNHPADKSCKLVDARGLLNALFEEGSRPSLRWLRQMQAQRRIPYVKIGHLVRFDTQEVRAALAETCTVRRRSANRTCKHAGLGPRR